MAPDHTRGAHPTAAGRLAMAVRSLSLRDASPGSESSLQRLVGTLLQRGCNCLNVQFCQFLMEHLWQQVDNVPAGLGHHQIPQ